MFIVEMIMPFLLYAGGVYKLSAGISFVALMAGIQLTGNFGYFNLLTTMMCIQTLDVHSTLTWRQFFLVDVINNTTVSSGSIRNILILILYILTS